MWADQIEPATPPASLQRDDALAGTAATMQPTLAWEGYPKVFVNDMSSANRAEPVVLLSHDTACICTTSSVTGSVLGGA